MYRIELAPGEETVYRTIEELAVSLRNGLVTSRSRIYHNATQKWLPIEFHPHYKKAIELSAHRQELPSAAPLPERLDSLNFAVPRPAVPAPPVSPPEPEPVAPEPVAPEPVVHAPVAQAPVAQTPAAWEPVANIPAPAPRVEPAPARRYEPPVMKAPPARRSAEINPAASVLFFASPAAVEDEPELRAPERSLPPVVASPVLQFPAIVYPEITPAEAPVAEAVSASARSRRPLHIAGAIVVLALGGYGMMSFAPTIGRSPTAAAEPSRPAVPAPTSAVPAPAVAEPAPRETTVKPVVMNQPASSGFAPALEPRAIVSSSAALAGTTRPAGVPIKDSSLAPAPVDILLDVPVLPGGDSLITPAARSDSAIKKILRAVNGGKDLPQRP